MTVYGRVGKALRLLQMIDEIASLEPRARELLVKAETELGLELGVECSGVPEPGGFDHSSGTCPVHEWLVESDHSVAWALAGKCPDCGTAWDGRGSCPGCHLSDAAVGDAAAFLDALSASERSS